MATPSAPPEAFTRAVEGLRAAAPREEILLEEIPAPQRLAPYSFAVSATVLRSGEEVASGRLILLHDPAGHEAWRGDLRLVTLVTAELEPDMAGDPLLPAVGWSWLTESLDHRGAGHTAVGGTVTQTTSTRFGDLHGPSSNTQLELRGSWTATEDDLSGHLRAFVDLLCTAAGLPPEGVAVLGER